MLNQLGFDQLQVISSISLTGTRNWIYRFYRDGVTHYSYGEGLFRNQKFSLTPRLGDEEIRVFPGPGSYRFY